MKTAILFLTVLFYFVSSNLSAAPVTYKDFQPRSYKISASQSLPYRLFIPKGYTASKKYPIMVTLHGAGERGTDDSLQLKYKFGLMWADSEAQAIRESFVLAPQCPPSPNQWVNRPWDSASYDFSKVSISTSMQAVVNILDSLGKEFSLDQDRYYVSGMSMGGYGTWYLLMKYPTKFAAAVPVCGAGDPKTASIIKDVPIWAFHSADDNVVPVTGSRDMITALKAEKGNPKYDEYAASLRYGHNSWDPASNTPGLAAWVLSQSKTTVSITPVSRNPKGSSPAIPVGILIQSGSGYKNLLGRRVDGVPSLLP